MNTNTYYFLHKEERLAYYRINREREIIRRRKKRCRDVNAPILPFGNRSESNKTDYKVLVFNYYGNECKCCGENNGKLLTIDHINDNGKEHGTKRCRYKGISLYRYLVKNNYPVGLQVLCFNCNIGKKNNGGICPHKIQLPAMK